MVFSLNAYYVILNFIQTNKKVSEIEQFYLVIQPVTNFLYLDSYKVTLRSHNLIISKERMSSDGLVTLKGFSDAFLNVCIMVVW